MYKLNMRIMVRGSEKKVKGIKQLLESKEYDIDEINVVHSEGWDGNVWWLMFHCKDVKTRNSIAEYLELKNIRHKVNWAF